MKVIDRLSYRIFLMNFWLLALSGLLWTIAAPNFYSKMSEEIAAILIYYPVNTAAEEENTVNLTEEDKNCRVRIIPLDVCSLHSKERISIISKNTFFVLQFREIPNPPPESAMIS